MPLGGSAVFGILLVFEWEGPAFSLGRGNLIYKFENYALDMKRRELRLGTELVSMEPQNFDLLQYLIESRDRVASKDDLILNVWKGRIVSEPIREV